MIGKLQDFFNTFLNPQAETAQGDAVQRTRLAVSALLLEIAVSDFESAPQERQTIIQIVKSEFGLEQAEADELISLAEQEHRTSTDYFQFTRLINEHYTATQKVELVELLWRVAFADGQLHHYEEHVIRRLTDLLHVSHGAFISAKHRAIEGMGRSDKP
jgi:uncharacterized tellurite resistance protein B-like protein